MTGNRVWIYVARYGEYDESVRNVLAFAYKHKAHEWIENTHTVLGDDAEWKTTDGGATEYAEDQIGNWAEIERVEVSEPVNLLDHGK